MEKGTGFPSNPIIWAASGGKYDDESVTGRWIISWINVGAGGAAT
jgi:hypothetical protein